MTEVKLKLADAASVLGVPVNTLRSRWKAGSVRGERDNSGRIHVWIDPEKKQSAKIDEAASEPSSNLRTGQKTPSEKFLEGALYALVEHMKAHHLRLEESVQAARKENYELNIELDRLKSREKEMIDEGKRVEGVAFEYFSKQCRAYDQNLYERIFDLDPKNKRSHIIDEAIKFKISRN